MNDNPTFMVRAGQVYRAGGWRGFALPALVAAASLALAFGGAILFSRDGGSDGVNRFVEALSGNSQSFLGGFGFLGFAFAAGLAAAVNPCGFAMLPAYMGLYMGSDAGSPGPGKSLIRPLGRALSVGVAVTAGFVALFSLAGTVIGLGARSALAGVLPWFGLAIGITLAIAGSWMLGGGKLYAGLAQRAASRIGDPNQVNVRGYFMFGLSYGIASLSCTLPIFLAVVGTTFAVSSIETSLGQFVLYALGMGTVIMTLTVGMAIFKGTVVGALRRALPYIQPVGTWMMIGAGTYIVFYWLTIGNLLP